MKSSFVLPPHRIDSTSTHLLRRASRHEDAAWRQLVELYGPLVRYWIRGAGLPASDLPDVFQEVFLALSRSLSNFKREEGTAKFRAWLKTVTLSKVHDQLRRRGREPPAQGGSAMLQLLREVPADGETAGSTDVSDLPLTVSEEVVLAQRALALVRQEFRDGTWQAFCLTTFDGLNSQQAAEKLGISALAVRKAKSRVLQRLKAALANSGPGSMSEMPE